MMNKYVRKLFGVMSQSKQTQQIVDIQQQHLPASPEKWRQYWQARGFPWRTEPEIDAKRQEELKKCRAIVPDIEKGIYPFKGMKLGRADVEWLLATHEDGQGPIDWKDQNQRKREGLDLRGADLHEVNLSRLPLARLRGGTSLFAPVVTMEYVDLSEAQLQGANLEAALLQHAEFYSADLEEANLSGAQLEGASFHRAFLEHVNFSYAKLESADLSEALLYSANLSMAHLN